MVDRHHRQRLVAGFGEAGQARLAGSHALIVGCGALGCVVADWLARAGVGRLTLVDRDVVELGNLQRQTLFDEADARAGTPKAHAAAARIGAIDRGVRTQAEATDFTGVNAARIALEGPLGRADVLVDGTDNFETRFLLNDLAVRCGIPFVHGGVVGTRGTALTVLPGASACLRCLFEGPPPAGTQESCETAGVLGAMVGVIASIQAMEAMKLLAGRADLVRRTLIAIDGWTNTLREVDLTGARDPGCPCCGLGRFEWLERPSGPVVLCGRGAVQVSAAGAGRVDLAALAARLGAHGSFEATRFLVRGALAGEMGEGGGSVVLSVFPDGRAIVQGVTDPARARSIYAKYVGG
jgi:adenylyltransferase/sulfurtransferase